MSKSTYKTISCEECTSPFTIPFSGWSRRFCSDKCRYAYTSRIMTLRYSRPLNLDLAENLNS